jgi:DNA mismatch endonuclease (patch repair protein)
MDMFPKKKRSEIMAAVRSTHNKLTETKLVEIFRRHGIRGWRRHLLLPGKPDFTFRQQRVVIFVDGCFWHGCAKHLRMPVNNRVYWNEKISRNMIRDRMTTLRLRKEGWKVVRIWEHELHRESMVLKRVAKALGPNE